ncbi:FAD-dependent oxidoreductase [Candidatus Babeliales bacterium]|nr:FAD-dependent oxidoreductase [Candidatus Babeliales bacterium]
MFAIKDWWDSMYYDYLIIGASAAGVAAATKIRSLDSEGTIGCIDKQDKIPYNTCLLVDVLSEEKTGKEISIKPDLFFEEKNIDLLLDMSIEKIEPQEKKVITSQKKEISYDTLLISTGTKARSIGSISGQGVFNFHELGDVDRIQEYSKNNSVKNILIIGAGLSGVEAADALVKEGCNIFIVERQSKVLPEFLNDKASHFLVDRMKKAGITILSDTTVQKCEKSEEIFSVTCSSGQTLSVEMILITTGSMQNICLAEEIGIKTDSCGVIVNEYLETSKKDIFAAGDVIGLISPALQKKVRNGTWPEAVKQGMIAAQNMVQQESRKYEVATVLTSSRFFDLAFVSGGLLSADDKKDVFIYQDDDSYYCFIKEKDRLLGVVMIGQLRAVGYVRRALMGLIPFDRDTFLQS